METATDPLRGAWRILALLWFVAVLNYLDRIMITTMRVSLVEAVPMTDAQFGLLTSVFLWVYGLLSPFAGFLADRFSRSRIIVGSVLVWSAVTWLTGQARTFEELLMARALMGISEACYIPAALALITDYHRGKTRSLAVGIHMTGIFAGAGAGGLGGWLAAQYNWNFAFHLFGIVGIFYSAMLAFFLHDVRHVGLDARTVNAPSTKPAFFTALRSLLKSGAFLVIFLYWGLLSLVSWAVTGWMPTFLYEQFDLAQGEAGILATTCSQGAALFGVLIGGAWADRWSSASARGRVFVPMVGLCIAAPAILVVSGTDTLSIALACLAIFGMTNAFNDANMMPILCQVADPRYRATGYGVLNLCGCLVGGLSNYIGGVLRDADVNVALLFRVAAIGMVVCIGLLVSVGRTMNAKTSSETAS